MELQGGQGHFFFLGGGGGLFWGHFGLIMGYIQDAPSLVADHLVVIVAGVVRVAQQTHLVKELSASRVGTYPQRRL